MDALSSSKPGALSIVIHGLILIALLLNPAPAIAEKTFDPAINSDDDIDAELKYLQEETYVITGSRIPQLMEKTAHSVFVVTNKEIQQMGARFLTDVVPLVPGWHVWTTGTGEQKITANGTNAFHAGEILIMINSHTLNDGWTGGAGLQYNLLSIDNAKQIEFMSGAGSAVYGSGAFGGVINIITKEAEDVDGLEAKISGGSYDTRQANILFGKSIKELEIAANLNFYKTDGFDGKVSADAQTNYDEIWGTNASLAPGNMKGDVEKWDGQLTVKFKGLTFDGKYTDSHADYPLGAFVMALDDKSDWDTGNYYLNLSYETSPWEGFNLLTKIYRNHYDLSVYSQVRPVDAVAITPTGPVLLQESTIVKPYYETNRTGIESQISYEITDTHTMVAGVMYEKMKFYDANIEANFTPTQTPGVIEPLPGFQDFPDWRNYQSPKDGNFKAIFWEDVWDIRDDLHLNVGCRYDDYSYFGDAVSPRAGLNWEFMENLHIKIHYGRAFRAPSLDERYDPTWGSKELDATTVDTYSLTFGVRLMPSFSGEIGTYYSKVKDYIVYDPSTFKLENLEEARSRGLKMKLKYDFGRETYIASNYAYIDAENLDTGESNWTIPSHMGSIMTNIRLNRYLNWNAHCIYRGGWSREKDDPRNDMSDYTVVNTTLIARKFLKGFEGLELALTVNNLFDEDYSSPTSNAISDLPDDLPMPGRNYLFELRYTY